MVARPVSTWVLLSGGIDSAACVAFYLEQHQSVGAVFVDYGQLSALREATAAGALAERFVIPLRELTWRGCTPKGGGEVRARNAFLLLAALLELPEETSAIALGVHAGSRYADCGGGFIQTMQMVFDIYTKGRIQVGAPFLEWSKYDIWAYCHLRKVPLDITYSCEMGVEQPCGACLSCRDLEALNARTAEHDRTPSNHQD